MSKFRLPVTQVQPPVEQPLTEARITGGMNSYIDPADIPAPVGVLARNARTSADYTSRAPGVEFVGETSLAGSSTLDSFILDTEQLDTSSNSIIVYNNPDNNPVLMYTQYARFDGTKTFLRFSPARIDRYTAGVPAEVTPTGSPLAGTAEDGIRFVQTADATRDYFIFANNGANVIQVLNTTVTTYGPLGNAGRYKYICAFFNRIVAANKVDATSPNPVLIAWSGDFNFTQWNPATDISAGSTPLVEAQSDYADPITGLFGFASVMLILRERSLWTATKRPVASNPFAFQAAFPYVGCDTPSSATQTRNGIVWYDFRANQVYVYEVGGTPQPIGDPIKNTLQAAISNKNLVWGSYDQVNNTYFLTVPSATSSLSRTFLYNFSTGSWTYDDRELAYGVYPVDGGAARQTYDQLQGSYDQLQAGAVIYNNIGLLGETPPQNYIGYKDGRLSYEVNQDDKSEGFEWISKIYRTPSGDQMVSRLMLLYEGLRSGEFVVEYSKNGRPWETYKTVPIVPAEGRKRAYFTKLIRANEFQWRITCSTGDFKLLEYKILMSASEEDKI